MQKSVNAFAVDRAFSQQLSAISHCVATSCGEYSHYLLDDVIRLHNSLIPNG